MDVYMSYKTKRTPSDLVYNCHSLALYLAKRHYKKVFFITDDVGRKFFKDLLFYDVTTEMNGVPESKMWALGKLETYKIAAGRRKEFIHIDYDVFLWKKLPTNIELSSVIVQSYESIGGYIDLDAFLDKFPEYYMKTPYASTMGIFGGSHFEFIKKYADIAIKLSTSPLYAEFFNEHPYILRMAIIIEQYMICALAQKDNIELTPLLSKSCIMQITPEICEKEAERIGFSHLGQMKNEEYYRNRVKTRCIEFNIPYK